MPVTENLTQSQGLLAELQRLQRRVSEQLAEKETELRGLSGTGTRLDQLQETLDGLQPEPGRWRAGGALKDRGEDRRGHPVHPQVVHQCGHTNDKAISSFLFSNV